MKSQSIILAAMLGGFSVAQGATAIVSTGSYAANISGENALRGGWNNNTYNGTAGMTFNVGTKNLVVTALGFYDGPNSASANTGSYTPDGLLEAHTVGIYDSSGVLVTSITIPTTGTTLVGEFQYVDLPTSVVLLANQNYTIAGQITTANLDVWRNDTFAGAFTFGSGFTRDTSGAGGSVPRAYSGPPTNNDYNDGIFQATNNNGTGYAAGNFQYIPEPSTSIALISGLALLGLRRRRA